jgi:hypothetical protein
MTALFSTSGALYALLSGNDAQQVLRVSLKKDTGEEKTWQQNPQAKLK